MCSSVVAGAHGMVTSCNGLMLLRFDCCIQAAFAAPRSACIGMGTVEMQKGMLLHEDAVC